jgi:hypothetical protein
MQTLEITLFLAAFALLWLRHRRLLRARAALLAEPSLGGWAWRARLARHILRRQRVTCLTLAALFLLAGLRLDLSFVVLAGLCGALASVAVAVACVFESRVWRWHE